MFPLCSFRDSKINSGNNIKFTNNACNGGHGISSRSQFILPALVLVLVLKLTRSLSLLLVGSVATGKVISNVVISGNVVTNSDNGLRIKSEPLEVEVEVASSSKTLLTHVSFFL